MSVNDISKINLRGDELAALVQRVFQPRPNDRALMVMIDLPDERLPDNPQWRLRRHLAAGWVEELAALPREALGLDVSLYLYQNVRANNADLPAGAWRHLGGELPNDVEELGTVTVEPFVRALARHNLILAPTELSATAPLKVLARDLGFRAATMPGFSPAMIPALRLDYTEVNRRVWRLKELLDRAVGADLLFLVDGDSEARLHLDLRHRTAHASGGLLSDPGTAGNLPSGEAYIVPYEGEWQGDPTRSAGELPVQHGDEVVRYRISNNVAVEVLSDGPESRREAQRLQAEPAYGNLAELGLGVLADLGITPINELLLDEKLGLHIAFGRSEHFGGQVGPQRFSSPEAVVHIDYVYINEIQPRVSAELVELELADGSRVELMKQGTYSIEL